MSGFGQILEDLNRAGVRYVLIGGIALIRHGVAQRATLQHGVVSRDQLRALGIGEDAIDYGARTGRLHPVFPAVYAVGPSSPTPTFRSTSAVGSGRRW